MCIPSGPFRYVAKILFNREIVVAPTLVDSVVPDLLRIWIDTLHIPQLVCSLIHQETPNPLKVFLSIRPAHPIKVGSGPHMVSYIGNVVPFISPCATTLIDPCLFK